MSFDTKKEAEKEDGKDAEREAVEHVLHDAIAPAAGAILAGIGAFEQLMSNKANGPTAAPVHHAQQRERIEEQEHEQE